MATQIDSPIVIESREELIAILCEASELEHMIMCQYLFAAFSLKRSVDEGLTEEQLAAVKRWGRVIEEVAVQEMLHLALVSNLLEAVGVTPHFTRPNMPQRAKYYPPAIQMALMPFSEHSLRHFIFLERPEGMALDDAPEFAVLAPADIRSEGAQLVPVVEDYNTVGQLYHGIEHGFRRLVEKHGEARVFVGPKDAQASGKYFRWPELIPVVDLNSAVAAIETVVEQGEGARGDWQDSHYGRFVGIMQEFGAMLAADPSFQPARPVVAARVRPAMDVSDELPIIADDFTCQVSDLFNAGYEVLLQFLIRFFVHSKGEESDEQLQLLADTAVGAMFSVIAPLGRALTLLPVGDTAPGKTAGATFEIFRTSYILPHHHAAWIVLHERLLELADYAAKLAADPRAPKALGKAETSFRNLAAAMEPHLASA